MTNSIRKFITATILSITLAIGAASAVTMVTTTQAEAGKVKLVKKGGKMVLRGIGRVGTKMSKSKNKVIRNAGKGLKKGSRKGTKGIDKASRGVNKIVRKTKTGRKIDNARRKAAKWKTKQLNKAFRKNRGKAGRFARNVLDAATSL